MMYSKLFSSLVHSSLWSQMDHVRLLFITLLALSDRDGIVYGSRSGLMRAAMIDLDAAEEHDPWRILMGPDDDSSDLMRNPENEGRRIEEIPGGFRIINYTYYRSLRDAEDRKAQNREAQQRHRDKVSPDKPPSAKVSRRKPAQSLSLSDSLSACKRRPKDVSEAVQYAKTKGISAKDAEAFYDSMEAGGWTRNGKALKNWQAAIRTWKANGWLPSQKQSGNGKQSVRFQDFKKRREFLQDQLNVQFRGARKDDNGRALFTEEELVERDRLHAELRKLS